MPTVSPNVSLCILARNGGKVICRAIESVLPHVRQVVVVDDGSTDGMIEIARNFCRDKDVAFEHTRIHPVSHPNIYRLDDASSFHLFEGTSFPGPFTGRQMLSDFAAARNIGWQMCSSDWIATLDCDDVVLNGNEISDNIQWAENAGVSYLHCHYDIHEKSNSHGLRCFAARRKTRWQGRIHEHLGAGQDTFSGSLCVRDMRDSGADRIPNHYFKVAYLTCQEVGWDAVSIHELGSVVMDMFFAKHAGWRRALDLLRRRAPGTELLEFVTRTTSS